jgi:hypothetical protein
VARRCESLSIAPPCSLENCTVRSERRTAERLIVTLRDVARHNHQRVQHLIDDPAKAPQKRVRMSRGQHVVKMDILAALIKRLLVAGHKRLAH